MSGRGPFIAGGTHTYASAGVYTAALTITDSGGSSTTTQSTITVTNPSSPGSLTINPAVPPNLTEGTPFNGTVATFTDSDTTQLAGDYASTITWGDGGSSSGTITGGNGTFTISAAHTYTDEGNDSITINVADIDGAQGQATTPVNLAEGDSLTATGVNVNATEGTAFNGPVATFTDTDTTTLSGDFTTTINWGDGSSPSTGTVTGSNGSFTINGAHTFTDEGSFVIQVGVGDDGSGTATAFTSSTATVAEGDAFTPQGLSTVASVNQPFSGALATFTDSDTITTASDLSALINWGDGSATTTGTVSGSGGSFRVSGTHTYTTAQVFKPTITLSDDSPGTATATADSTITVTYADTLAVTATAIAAIEGTGFNGQVATFTDSNLSLGSGAFTTVLNWGDGSATTTGTVSGSNGDFTVTGNHTFADEGSYPVQVTVSESQAAPASSTATATVADADLFTPQSVPTVSATEGVTFNGTVAGFSDAFTYNSSDLTAIINCGDGSSTTTGSVVPQASGLWVEASHTYAEEGSYQILVTLKDPGGTSATVSVRRSAWESDDESRRHAGQRGPSEEAGGGRGLDQRGEELLGADSWPGGGVAVAVRAPASGPVAAPPTSRQCGMWVSEPCLILGVSVY